MQIQQLRFEIDPGAGPAPARAEPDASSCSFAPLEWLAIAFGQQEGIDGRAGVFRLGASLRGLFGGPRVRRMAVDRLEVLSRIAARAEIGGGCVADDDAKLFHRAGFSHGQLLLLLASLEQARRIPAEALP